MGEGERGGARSVLPLLPEGQSPNALSLFLSTTSMGEGRGWVLDATLMVIRSIDGDPDRPQSVQRAEYFKKDFLRLRTEHAHQAAASGRSALAAQR